MHDTLEQPQATDRKLVAQCFAKLAEDLSLLLDRPLTCGEVEVARARQRIAGEKVVHVAFRLGVTVDGTLRHGALLVPLGDSIAMACYLMMMADDVVAARRKDRDLERATKDALLEVGNLMGGSLDCAIRELFPRRTATRSEGCQGLKPGVAPAFPRAADEEHVLARATLTLHEFPAFDAWLMLPSIAENGPASVSS
ncbi:MAG: hypothetical protein FJ298_00690 [Planctomycetes bacterium]|nr:hypothetical protein [Planctomycetota bacterium]